MWVCVYAWEGQERRVSFGLAQFDMPNRHPSGDVRWSLEMSQRPGKRSGPDRHI